MSLASHLTLGTRWTFVGGKGGVGKTTIAAALAVEIADRGDRVTILSTDPAHSLGDALGLPLGPDPRSHPELPSLEAFELSAAKERAEFLAASGDAIAMLIERGTYLDAEDAGSVTDLALPGMDELAALLRLARLAEQGERRVLIDTAPTGHTLRLLDLPAVGLAWLESLEAMQAKHEAVASAFSGGRVPADDASRFVAGLRRDLEGLSATFANQAETRFVLVTNADAAVHAETRRYRAELERRGIALGGIVLNRARTPPDKGDTIAPQGIGDIPHGISDLDISLRVPLLGSLGRDLPALRLVARMAAPERPTETSGPTIPDTVAGRTGSPEKSAAAADIVSGAPYVVPEDRRLYLIGGKGGVGKSTVAAALAESLATARRGPILLLSVDPAGSLNEILGWPVGPVPEIGGGIGGLFAQQIDARTSWEDFTNRYRAEVESLFAGFGGANMSVNLDRAVLDRLLDLAPPGVDELMAVMEVIDLLEDGEYDALVVDTAPTGHFLRLLELPDVALEWSHAIMRLLLKYRSVVRLEGPGERILKLSRSLKSLRSKLVDPAFTWLGIVALAETLSIPESARLVEGLRRLGIEPAGLIVNQALLPGGGVLDGRKEAIAELLRIDATIPAVAAPRMSPPPTGAESLRAFRRGWRAIAAGG